MKINKKKVISKRNIIHSKYNIIEVIIIDNNIIELKKSINLIKQKGWIPCSRYHYGAIGLTLEKLLKINTDNYEIPDYNGIEIKTKKSNKISTISLFSATPDSYLYEIKRIHNLYAYPYTKNPHFKVLNKIIKQGELTYIYNKIFFTLKVDKNNERISLIVLDNNFNILDTKTSWSFSLIKEKLERKLKYLCYVEADTIYSNSQLYVKFINDTYYKLKNFDQFIELLENGKILITFRIGVYITGKKKGQIHDHGTTFSIDEKDIESLFNKI